MPEVTRGGCLVFVARKNIAVPMPKWSDPDGSQLTDGKGSHVGIAP